MRNWILGSCIALALPCVAVAQQPAAADNASAEFLTDDFQAVESDGDGERAKLHVLREVEHCMYIDYMLQLFQVQPLGPDYAFVTYESSMQFPRTSTLRFRRVFVGELWTRREGKWKMMRYQETQVR